MKQTIKAFVFACLATGCATPATVPKLSEEPTEERPTEEPGEPQLEETSSDAEIDLGFEGGYGGTSVEASTTGEEAEADEPEPVATPAPRKQRAKLGEACGGRSMVACDDRLYCKYEEKHPKDKMGVCDVEPVNGRRIEPDKTIEYTPRPGYK